MNIRTTAPSKPETVTVTAGPSGGWLKSQYLVTHADALHQRWRSAHGQRQTLGDADQRSWTYPVAKVKHEHRIFTGSSPPRTLSLQISLQSLCNIYANLPLCSQEWRRPSCPAIIRPRVPRERGHAWPARAYHPRPVPHRLCNGGLNQALDA
jgi:hypothetical protein